MKMSQYLFVLCCLVCLRVGATALPENNLNRFDNPKRDASIDQATFNKVIDTATEKWIPFATGHGATLTSDKKWDDSTVNAYANQNGTTWTVYFYGGLARREEMTPDGFMLVVCHELGHHFGGYYFSAGPGMAAEGQADYFSSHVCMREVWKDDARGNEAVAALAPKAVKDSCESVWSEKTEQDLCARISLAAMSIAKLSYALFHDSDPNFEKIDTAEVPTTNQLHPGSQCRLDTYVAASVCKAKFDLTLIPGKGIAAGSNSIEAEKIAAENSCMASSNYTKGLRPRCWFKALAD